MSRTERPRGHPIRGALIGLITGVGLCFIAAAAGSDAMEELEVTESGLLLVYLGGGTVSGLIGGLLWPYQRSRLETLVFAIPTAVPLYMLGGFVAGWSIRVSLWAAFASGLVYALIYGGEHAPDAEGRQSVSEELPDEKATKT